MTHLSPNHGYNLEKCEDLFKVIIFHVCPPKRRDLATWKSISPWLLWILSKVKITKKWNDYMQRITVSWFSFHTISRTSSSLWILASINQQRNLSQTSSTHGMLKELANNCQTELHLAMLKYPSNWVIRNFFMLGGLLWYTIISSIKMIPLLKGSARLQGSARLSHVQKISSHK